MAKEVGEGTDGIRIRERIYFWDEDTLLVQHMVGFDFRFQSCSCVRGEMLLQHLGTEILAKHCGNRGRAEISS